MIYFALPKIKQENSVIFDLIFHKYCVAPCSCTMEGVEGTYTNECLGDVSVVTCLNGKINVSLSDVRPFLRNSVIENLFTKRYDLVFYLQAPGDTVAFDRATCMRDGSW